MRKLSLSLVVAFIVALSAVTLNPPTPVAASPADDYAAAAPYFGAGNLPPGCENDVLVGDLELRALSTFQDPKSFGNVCHHMRTDMNALDSPQVDVLVMVPASPTAERDMRIMRQSVEMWEGGIDYLAEEMGLGWLAQGMDFHITVDSFDPTGDGGGEFTTYPIVDPEIVVVAANPAVIGYAGIGIDPVNQIFVNEDLVPCHVVGNPFDLDQWEALPGFNSHHDGRSGTYVEDCGGSGGGGNICFAVNAGSDTPVIDLSSLFDLVSHEFGHCLTIGHVGDGAEGRWGATPTNDIMAYSSDPPGLSKCVSTLDVEGVALRMSKYLDVNGDGAVTAADQLFANDSVGQGANDFQIQHPDDHLYASSTGDVTGCPQPDTGALPGPRTDWTPTPVRTSQPELTITSPEDGAINDTGVFDITGTVEHAAINNDPTEPTASVDDADDDATTPVTEITQFDVAADATHVNATISLAELWPSTQLASPTSYTVNIDGRQFDSFIRYAIDNNPMTWDSNGGATGTGGYMPAGTSTWDLDANTVTFKIPRTLLAAGGSQSPYYVASSANIGLLTNAVVDDSAPDGKATVGVASSSSAISVPDVSLVNSASTVTFEQKDDAGNVVPNVFYTEESTLGQERGTSDYFSLNVPQTSDVEFTLDWTDAVGGSDLDVYVTGAADSENEGATAARPEMFTLEGVSGLLNIKVDPYLVTDAVTGSTYTLTATLRTDTDADGVFDDADLCPAEAGIAPTGCPDSDGDGVVDVQDTCPGVAGDGADGCALAATEFVHLWVGGAIAATQAVDTTNGLDTFSLSVGLAKGTFEVRVDWEDNGQVIASRTLTLSNDSDFDDDGAADHTDNCRDLSNPDQADMDGDGRGDLCDSDKDGDGHSNDKEISHGTDPSDPGSYPGKTTAVGV